MRAIRVLWVVGWALAVAAGAAGAGDRAPAAVIVEDSAESRGFLGVQTREETEGTEGGARVEFVVPDSPASAAGIREGDVIVSIAGQTVRGPAALAKRVAELEPGTKTKIVVVRGGDRETVEVELGESRRRVMRIPSPDGENQLEFEWRGLSEEDQMRIEEDVERAIEELERHRGDLERHRGDLERQRGQLDRFRFAPEILPFGGLPGGKPVLGVRLVAITPELREMYGAKDAGVLVGGVEPDSPAARAGIQVGDVVVSVAGQAVVAPSDVLREVVGKRGERVAIELLRDGKKVTVQADLPAPDAPAPDGAWPRARVIELSDVREQI